METLLLHKNEKKDILLLDSAGTELHVIQHAGSRLCIHMFHLTDLSADYSVTVEHEGEGCMTEIAGLVVTRGEQQVNCLTRVRHNKGGGTSRQLLKYILTGKSIASFTGELYIAPDAQKTDAQQTNRNLLLSTEARIETKPQLEIYADDVKASHGASTGQLDEKALFYMQQRCLSAPQARHLLLQAFAEETVAHIEDNILRQTAKEAVDARLEQLNTADLYLS